jgi:hypothetical protein
MAVKVCFHTLRMGDVEDPYLYAAFPISEWQKTEHGQWVMDHAIGESTFWCDPDPETMGYRVAVVGELTDEDNTYHALKWGMNK